MKMLKYVVLMVCLSIVISCDDNDDDCTICLEEAEKERVVSFVNAAIAHIDAVGVEAAYSDFSVPNPKPEFIDGELYIFVINIKNIGIQNIIMKANGADDSLIGTNIYDLEGKRGKMVVQDFAEVVNNSEQNGWSTYHWNHPLTDEIKEKHSYLVKVGDLIVGAGLYE